MHKLGILALSLPFLVCPSTLGGQQAPPTPAQFKAVLHSVGTDAPQWRRVIEGVKIEELPINYAVGKQFEQNKHIVNEDLKMVVLLADRITREGSLYDEVNFMSSVQELQSQLQLFGSLLNEFEMSDPAGQKKIADWSEALSNLADGPIQQVFTVSFADTTHRAYQVEQSCRTIGK